MLKAVENPLAKALEAVAGVMRAGAVSHPDNDWVRRTTEHHIGRAEESTYGCCAKAISNRTILPTPPPACPWR